MELGSGQDLIFLLLTGGHNGQGHTLASIEGKSLSRRLTFSHSLQVLYTQPGRGDEIDIVRVSQRIQTRGTDLVADLLR